MAMQVPATHSVKVAVGLHTPPQVASLAGHAQAPLLQTWSSRQAAPQDPQFLLFLFVLTQEVSHTISPAEQSDSGRSVRRCGGGSPFAGCKVLTDVRSKHASAYLTGGGARAHAIGAGGCVRAGGATLQPGRGVGKERAVGQPEDPGSSGQAQMSALQRRADLSNRTADLPLDGVLALRYEGRRVGCMLVSDPRSSKGCVCRACTAHRDPRDPCCRDSERHICLALANSASQDAWIDHDEVRRQRFGVM